MNDCNVIITGIPRSGTTLACTLLADVPNTVALNEPMDLDRILAGDGERDRLDSIDRFFAQTRASLLTDGTAVSKQADGIIVDNNFGAERSEAGARTERVSRGVVSVDRELDGDLLLCAKHPGLFTAMLDALADAYPCYAIVRNPLGVLASWNAVDISARDGRSPAAEALDPTLADELASIDDVGDRQLRLLSWFFEQYRETLPDDAIVRYEDVVASGGAALKTVAGACAHLDEPLENRNDSKLYDREAMRVMGERLLRSDGAYWDFYPRESVEELL